MEKETKIISGGSMPSNKEVLWLDTSKYPFVLKAYKGTKWVPAFLQASLLASAEELAEMLLLVRETITDPITKTEVEALLATKMDNAGDNIYATVALLEDTEMVMAKAVSEIHILLNNLDKALKEIIG